MPKKNSKEISFWNVDETLKSYKGEPDLKKQAEGQYTGIINFMNENGLFKKKRKTVNAKGELAVREVFASDLTEEGIAFVRVAHSAWFNSKASAKNSTNVKLLEKYLKQVRKGK